MVCSFPPPMCVDPSVSQTGPFESVCPFMLLSGIKPFVHSSISQTGWNQTKWIRDAGFEARGHPWGTFLALMLILSFHGTPSSCG